MDFCYFIPSSPDLHWQQELALSLRVSLQPEAMTLLTRPPADLLLEQCSLPVEGALLPAALIYRAALAQPLQMFTHFMILLSQKKETEEQSKTRVLPAVTISTICCFPECRR